MSDIRISVPVLALTAGLLASGAPDLQAQLRGNWDTDFSKHTVPLEEIVSGGPGKDGIPALDDPRFVSVDEADSWLGRREPVAVVRHGGEVKAYPLQILIWHEIVNDRVGGRPVAVTFCPLCNTTLAFDRRFDGKVLDFGTTGRLRHSDMVMYDRQTESWWQQATGEGIVGRYAGEELEFVPAPVLSWSEVEKQHPGARVLSRETGYDRPYGENPYRRYDSRTGPIERFFSFGESDGRLLAMERVVALHERGESLAVPYSKLEDERMARVEVGGRELVVFWAPGTASAVDTREIERGRAVGSTNVFEPTVNGRELTFEATRDGRFRDQETETLWTLSGDAVEGELAGERLTPVSHGTHFWFAWKAFRPDTRVWEP